MAKKKKKRKSRYSLSRLFTPKQRWGFVAVVGVLTLLLVGLVIYRNHRLEQKVQAILDMKETLTPQEHQALLDTPTVHEYMFPYGVRDFGSTLQPVRNLLGVWSVREKEEMWLDVASLGIEELPQLSLGSLHRHLEGLRAKNPHF